MKVLAVSLAVLAVLIAVVPQFTDCDSQGRTLTLQDGRQIAMKCHWTARAELGVGLPLFAVAATIFFQPAQGDTEIPRHCRGYPGCGGHPAADRPDRRVQQP